MRLPSFAHAPWLWAGLGIALPMLGYWIFLIQYAVNIPQQDDYDNLLWLLQLWREAPDWQARLGILFSQHNEHRLAFNRLISLGLRSFTCLDLRALMAIGNLALMGVAGLMLWSYRQRPAFRWMAVLCAWLLFQPLAHDSLLWAMAALANYWVVFWSLLSFALLWHGGWRGTILGLQAAAAALYTMGNGILVLPLGGLAMLASLWGEGRQRFQPRQVLFWWLGSVFLIGLYFHGYAHPPHHAPLSQALNTPPLVLLRYFLMLLGGAFAQGRLDIALMAGSGLLAGFIYLAARGFYRQQPVLFWFALWLLGSMASISLSRINFGLESALWSRYLLHSQYFAALCLLGLLDLHSHRLLRPALLALAMIQAGMTYAHSSNEAGAEREILLQNFALYQQSGNPARLDHPLVEHAGQRLQYATAHGDYVPPDLSGMPLPPDLRGLPPPVLFDRLWRRVEVLDLHQVLSRPPSLAGMQGHVDSARVEPGLIRLIGWGELPVKRYTALLVALPRLPLRLEHDFVDRPDVAEALGRPELTRSGFDIRLYYPAGVELDKIASQLCLATLAEGRYTLVDSLNPECRKLLKPAMR